MTTAKKTPGLIGLERIVDSIDTYSRDETKVDIWNELIDQLNIDTDGRAPEGMKLLVRVALAARQWRDFAAVDPATEPDAVSLIDALQAFERWEDSL